MKQRVPAYPHRCRFVVEALLGKREKTLFVRNQTPHAWRYLDLILVTGRGSAPRKLRELREALPGVVTEEERKNEKTGTIYKVFRITRADRNRLYLEATQ